MTAGWIALAAMLQGQIGAPASPSAAAATALQPVGKWAVDYADAMCILSRDFGSQEAPVTLAIRPMPVGDLVEVDLIDRAKASGTHRSSAIVVLSASRTPHSVSATVRMLPDGVRRLTSMAVTKSRTELPGAGLITITVAKRKPVSIAATGIDLAVAALETCQRDLLTRWKIDPDYRRAIVHEAVPQPIPTLGVGQWILSDDYPNEARRAQQEGTTTVMWTIGVDGRAHDCRLLGSSGTTSLDQITCAAILQRARYLPAQDKDGHPIVSYDMAPVTWVIQ